MLPDSQIRIVQQTPAELLAYDPPYYVFGALFIAFGMFVLAVMLVVSYRSGRGEGSRIAGYVVAGLFVAIGVTTLTLTSRISLSRKSGDLSLSKVIFGVSMKGEQVALSEIQEARVEQVKNLRRVVVVLRDGRVVYLTSATDREGYYEFAKAINGFLGH